MTRAVMPPGKLLSSALELEDQLAKTKKRLLELQTEFDDRTEWALKLDRQLDQTGQRLLKLQAEFDDRTEWALELDARLAEVRDAIATPSLPDRFLMDRVVGEDSTEEDFRQEGFVNWLRVRKLLQESGFDFNAGGAVLDFGCGCGRLLRFFQVFSGVCDFHGADVDNEAVSWCRNNIGFASFSALSHDPPSSYPSCFFDAVYAYSVFTHLPEDRHHAWLDELYRITRPGAILVLTIQGQNVIDLVVSGARDLGSPSAAELRNEQDALRRDGFAFFPYSRIVPRDSKNRRYFERWNLEQYGNAFILETYVRERWVERFEVVAFHSAPDGWQDFVILERKE